MKKYIFFLILYILPYILLAQNKYFEKQYVWNANFNNNGYTILQKLNDNYIINGTTLDTSWVWHSFIMEINNYGTVEQVKNYLNTEYATFSRTMIKNDDVYLLSGSRQHQETYNVDAYIGILDSNYNLNLINTETPEDNINIYGSCQTQSGYFLVGSIQPYAIPNVPYSYPYLLKLDSLGNQVWDSIYYSYNTYNNLFKDIVPADDGTYYIGGGEAFNDTQCDVLFLNMNEQGTILWDKTYDFGGKEGIFHFVKSYEDGFILSISKTLDNESIFLRIDDIGNEIWQLTVNLLSAVPLQTSDSSYIFTGLIETPTGDSNMGLLKISQNGELLWRRQYGGTDNDYGYDIIETSDGGYIVCGRTESNSEGADLYVVKTNCMGLLTEPQANFMGELDHQNLIATAYNESLYVYPDSIDGGHFIWDFGDDTPFIVSNTAAPQTHTYMQAGKYTATLQAIVCNDTSIFKRTYCIGTSDAIAIFDYENTGGLGISFSPQNAYHDAAYIWHFGDENISFEQHPTHIYAQNGHYEVSLSIVLCNDTISFSQNILVGNVGFQENINGGSDNLFVFPNPAKNTIFVETRHALSKTQNYEIAIYNHLGQKVYENKNFIIQNAIHVQNLTQGSYFLHLKDEESSIVKPFVIMR